MKKTLLITLLLIVGCSKSVEDSTLINKDGLMYLPDSDSPYSGEVYFNYDTGEKLYTGRYKNGLLIDYSYLKKDGSVKTPINDETLIEKDGLIYDPNYDEPYNGEVVMYYDTGEKEYQGTYENGLLVKYSYLNKDGSIKEPVNGATLIDRGGLQYEVNGQKPYTGDVFDLYKDGGKKYTGSFKGGKFDKLWTSWYENGEKEFEKTWKDGKKDGLWTSWYENGEKKDEATYNDGKEDGLWTFWQENGQKSSEGTSAPPGKVWSEEHGHYHDIQPSRTPIPPMPSDVQRSLNVPQPEGLAPEGKIWSTEHGHWHDITPTSNPLSESTSTNIPQPKGSVPEGKEWSSEHGHWHDIEK